MLLTLGQFAIGQEKLARPPSTSVLCSSFFLPCFDLKSIILETFKVCFH